MKVFGKSLSEYFAFEKAILVLIVLIGAGRLGLSLAGVPNASVKWISLTAMALVGVVYCAVKVPRTGFGGYKHLLPLYMIQAILGNIFIVGGIVLAVLTGVENIYSAPEYSGGLNPWVHAGTHVLAGVVIGPFLSWLIGSGVMFVVKKMLPVNRNSPVSA